MAAWFYRSAIALIFMAVSQSVPAQIINPGFEDNSGAPPSSWFLSDAASQKGLALVVETPARILRLAPNDRNVPGPEPLGVGQALTPDQLPRGPISVRAKLAAEGGATAVVGVVALDKSGTPIASATIREEAALPQALQQHETEMAELPPETSMVIVFASVEGMTGAAYFDEIELSEQSQSTARMANPVSDEMILITIDPEHSQRRIPPNLFGANVEWIRNANGLWDADKGEVNAEMVSLAKAAGITNIRFPGGVWSDAYNWRDGVGPASSRPKTPHVPGDREHSRHVIGSDEIAAIARQIGATLTLTVNVGNGSAEEAGAWAAYMRDTHGADLVSLWEIGNELYMDGDMSGGARGPEAYAADLQRFAAAIRSEIPDAAIAGIGLLNYGNYKFNSHPDWNEIVLKQAGEAIDFFAVHNAYAPVVATADMSQGAQVYASMHAAPDLIAQNLKDTSALIQAFATDRNPVKIAVTEWGPLFTVDPANPYFDHVKTLGSAIFVARTLNTFLRDPNTEFAHFFKLSDLLNMGWIGLANGGGIQKTPALQAFGLYANPGATDVLALDLESPTFDSRETAFVSSVRGANLIDALAMSAPDGVVHVFINSADLERPYGLRIKLTRPGTYRLEKTVLTGRAPDAHNGTRMIDVPGLAFAAPEGFSDTGAFENPQEGDIALNTSAPEEVSQSFEATLPPHSLLVLKLVPQ